MEAHDLIALLTALAVLIGVINTALTARARAHQRRQDEKEACDDDDE